MQVNLVFGASKSFRRVIETAESYAASDWPVLLLGETGVGKELIARRVHAASSRRAGTFLPVNCGAIPAGLFESELFGHERGAFSGALQASRGLVRAANGGTIFLDEIGELGLEQQVKLLRWLDSGEVRAVGSARTERPDVRLVAATNVDLSTAVGRGRFRLDLLERLSVLTLRVPALRDRPEDLRLLATYFASTLGVAIDEPVLDVLSEFDWPGNVRQLRNVLIRAVVGSGGKLSVESARHSLADETRPAFGYPSDETSANPLDGSLADIEKRVIVDRLRRYEGNRKKTARELGIAKSTLQEKIKRLGSNFPELALGGCRLSLGA